MDNFEIIKSLSKTSEFNTGQIEELLLRLKSNLKIDSTDNDHLEIRAKISNRHEFADAQADCNFSSCF